MGRNGKRARAARDDTPHAERSDTKGAGASARHGLIRRRRDTTLA